MHVNCSSQIVDEKKGSNIQRICSSCNFSKEHSMTLLTMLEIDGGMLQDAHLNRASLMLRKQFPDIGSLHTTLYVQALESFGDLKYDPVSKDTDCIQFMYTGRKHWVTCTIEKGGVTPVILDSYAALGTTSETETQLAMLMNCQTEAFQLTFPSCAQQTVGDNCGLFAIAHATHFAFTRRIEFVNFDEEKLRQHWNDCILKGVLTCLPTKHGKKKASKLRHSLTSVYCTCRLPQHYDSSKMYGCEECSEWYHPRRVNLLEPPEGDYICESCSGNKQG
ncbi:hypothetical protein ONE63_011388 [Megalurothrips usitatus]|uniref:Zinc finger PHD-type domain-containing protein n=1 Tax=Megalurothrips usitatus TaxID=439358 RepID=A0AAV7X3J8_9NEOP|nr:hypothetical protein ONE63_011388 [Megalurothrips usitatus]